MNKNKYKSSNTNYNNPPQNIKQKNSYTEN
jgi:hypothetical protein